MASFIIGCIFLISYLLLLAGLDVYVGHLTQNVDPIRLVFWCFSFTIIFYLFTHRSLEVNLFKRVKSLKGPLLYLNFATALAWLSYFVSLKFWEPMLVAVVSCSVTPILTAYFSKFLRPQSKVLLSEKIAAAALILIIVLTFWQSLNGKSALGLVSSASAWIGFVTAFFCGFGMTFCTLFSKKLNDSGLSSHEIMVTRFWLMVIMSGVACAVRGNLIPESSLEWYSILVVGFGGNIIGLYLLQKGIERLEPTTVSFFFAGAPIAVLPFQWLDPRLSVSSESVVVALLTLGIMLWGIWAKVKFQKI